MGVKGWNLEQCGFLLIPPSRYVFGGFFLFISPGLGGNRSQIFLSYTKKGKSNFICSTVDDSILHSSCESC